MNNDLISREALRAKCNELIKFNPTTNRILDLIDNAPAVERIINMYPKGDVIVQVKRPQGEWYYNCQNGWHCSICHETIKDMPTVMGKADFNFCPHCGAEMKGGKEE